jgi:hypothetical protein
MTKLTKEQWIYVGVGLFVFLVLLSSTRRKVALVEVIDPQTDKVFDYTKLPASLQPPTRYDDSQELPRPIKRNFSLLGINLKPRFDR